MRPPVFASLLFIAVLAGGVPSALLADAGEPVDFAREIAPIFEAHCVRCHNRDERKGKFSLGSAVEAFAKRRGYERAIIPGDPDNSLLIELITPPSPGAQPDMPEEGDPLSTQQIARLRRWIAEGAKWPIELKIARRSKADKTWWSLQPLRPVTIPNVDDAPLEWSQSPIDQFVLAGLRAKGLRPSGRAERRVLLRRATYDLTGLPPTPEELTAFLDDRRPDAYERVVDRLLASPRYGEHWGRHWLDVVRFGESTGFERNLIHDNAWPFRDYIIRSLNDDKPFDRLIVEHLAGDQLAPGDSAIEVGTGFLVGGPYDNVGNQDPKAAAQIRANTLDEIVSTTASAFLGVTLHCARCHDHKFDPIPQSDYYRVQAAFSGVEQGARELATAAQRDDLKKKRATLDQAIEETKRDLAELGNENGTDAAQVTSERKRLSERKAALEAERKNLPQLPTAWIGTFKQPGAPAYLMLGGDPQQRGAEIAPGSLGFLDHCADRYELAINAPEAERRMALAKWIVAENNPLPARVLANRVWQYHFGTGIVDTPNDFGYMGGRPSHPALLDFLAGRLKQHGWRLKPLHREIMLSATYRQSSAWEKSGSDADSSARLLWRFPPRRLSAEEVRDTILAVAGKLDLQKMGGAGFRLYRYFNDNVSTYVPLDRVGPETYRRAVYHQNARASTVDLLSDFDAPDCAFSAPRRANTTTPLQALTLFNHAFTIDMAEHFAERLRAASAKSLFAAVDHAFLLISARAPSDEERQEAISLIDQHGLRAFCRALLNSSELMYVD